MKEYHKIETLLDRDEKFKVIDGKWRLPEFDYLKNNLWLWTEKIDGANVRVMYNGIGQMKFGGKTDNAQMPTFLVDKLNQLFKPQHLQEIFGESEACLYGEGFGAKIQKGGGLYNPSGCDFILFDVKVGEWWLERENVEDIANKLNIKIVPIVGKGTLPEAIAKTKEGVCSTFGAFIAEGIVVRPPVSLCTRRGERLIGKIKTKDF